VYLWQWVWTPWGWQYRPVWVGYYRPWAVASAIYPGSMYGYTVPNWGGVYWTYPGQAVGVHYDTP
jgi:hypothetical protein